MNVGRTVTPALRCEVTTLASLFSEKRFSVPWHQRNYDWSRRNVSELLEDLLGAVQKTNSHYFLGLIMIFGLGHDVWEINDGQQRMTTFSLICALLRDKVNKRQRERIDKLLSHRSEPRLEPPHDTRTQYKSIIRGDNVSPKGRLGIAVNEINRFISELKPLETKRFASFLLDKVEVACLYMTGDTVDPNLVFETINCRGKAVDSFDLLRNNLYSYFNDAQGELKNEIHTCIERIRPLLGRDKLVSDYARAFFQCQYGFLPKDTFYRKVRTRINSQVSETKSIESVIKLVYDFTDPAQIELFRTISKQDLDGDFLTLVQRRSGQANSPRTVSIFLQELSVYTVTYPMIFAFLSSCHKHKLSNAKDLYEHLKLLNTLIIRKAFVTPKFEPSRYESKFATFARQIWDAGTLDKDRLNKFLDDCDRIGESVMDDNKFINTLSQVEMRNSIAKVKTLLYGINHYQYRHNSPEKIIPRASCIVEYILPKDDQQWMGWKGFKGHNPMDWVHKVGNFTLLGQNDHPLHKQNGSQGSGFSAKKETFRESSMAISRDLADYRDWSPSEIKKRQRELAQSAAKVWEFN